MSAINVRNEVNIGVTCGSSGSGKSWFTKEQVKSAPRLLVFDPEDEYSELKTVDTLRELLQLLASHEHTPLRARIVKQTAQAFDVFCRAAFVWGSCAVVAEELATFTSAGKAPQGWHMLVSRGRKRGISVYAVTQRPAESDKTVIGNASWLHVGRLTRANDRKYMAAELDIDCAHLDTLTGQEFIHKKLLTGEVFKGQMGTKRKEIIK